MSLDALRRGTAAWHLVRYGVPSGGVDDFRGASLVGVDLAGASLGRLIFDRADLSGARLADADLSGSRFDGARLVGADLSRVSARDLSARDADFSGVRAGGADLRGVDAERGRWVGADLAGVDGREARFVGANLSDARCGGSDLRGAGLHGARLGGADLSGSDLRGADLRRADLTGAELAGARLQGAVADRRTRWPEGFAVPPEVCMLAPGAALDGLVLSGAGWSGLDLRGARLAGARWSHVSSDLADLAGADLRGAVLVGGRFELGAFADARFEGARLVGAALPWSVLGARGLGEAAMSGVTLLPERTGRRVGGQTIALPGLAQVGSAVRFEGAVAAGELALELDGAGWRIELAVARLPASVVVPGAGRGWLGRLFGGDSGSAPRGDGASNAAPIDGWPPGAAPLDADDRALIADFAAAGGRIEGGRIQARGEGSEAIERARQALAVGQICAAAFDPRIGAVSVVVDAGAVSLVEAGGLTLAAPKREPS